MPAETTRGIAAPTVATGTPRLGDTRLPTANSFVFGTNGPNTISETVTTAALRNCSDSQGFLSPSASDKSTNGFGDASAPSRFTTVAGLVLAQTAEDSDGTGLPAENPANAVQNNFAAASTTASFSLASRMKRNDDGINATLLTGVTRDPQSSPFMVQIAATGRSAESRRYEMDRQ